MTAATGIRSCSMALRANFLRTDKPLVPLGGEGRFSVQGLEVPAWLVEEYQREGVFGVLGVVDYRGDKRSTRPLARAHPSGTWLEWLDADTAC